MLGGVALGARGRSVQRAGRSGGPARREAGRVRADAEPVIASVSSGQSPRSRASRSGCDPESGGARQHDAAREHERAAGHRRRRGQALEPPALGRRSGRAGALEVGDGGGVAPRRVERRARRRITRERAGAGGSRADRPSRAPRRGRRSPWGRRRWRSAGRTAPRAARAMRGMREEPPVSRIASRSAGVDARRLQCVVEHVDGALDARPRSSPRTRSGSVARWCAPDRRAPARRPRSRTRAPPWPRRTRGAASPARRGLRVADESGCRQSGGGDHVAQHHVVEVRAAEVADVRAARRRCRTSPSASLRRITASNVPPPRS